MLGHADIHTTEAFYGHYDLSDLEAAMEAFARPGEVRSQLTRPSKPPLRELWAHLGSNQGPLACEASALPLSYAPGRAQG